MKKITVSFAESLESENEKNMFGFSIEVLKELFPSLYLGDKMILADRNVSFLSDNKFLEVSDQIAKADVYKGMLWRVHTLLWAVDTIKHLTGDFVECGVFRGFKSYFILKYFADVISDDYWLYDTFSGQPSEYQSTSPVSNSEHNKPLLLQFVKERFSEFKNVKIIQGTVPSILYNNSPKAVKFLHLDLNSTDAEIGALDFFYNRIVKGGIIVLDDYGHLSFKDQMVAQKKWFKTRDCTVLELPTGQGIVIKK